FQGIGLRHHAAIRMTEKIDLSEAEGPAETFDVLDIPVEGVFIGRFRTVRFAAAECVKIDDPVRISESREIWMKIMRIARTAGYQKQRFALAFALVPELCSVNHNIVARRMFDLRRLGLRTDAKRNGKQTNG